MTDTEQADIHANQPKSNPMATVDLEANSASVPEVDYQGGGIQRDRPFSASQRTTASTTSKSTRSSHVFHTKHTSKGFWSYRPGVFEAAVTDIQERCMKQEIDGEFKAAYLLTEIDHWDCEKEKLVVLCEKSLLVIKYDFITPKVYDAKRMLLHNIQKLAMGDFEYPSMSVMPTRGHGGVRISWDKDLDVSWATRWNPFSNYVPYWTFSHHPLIYYEKEMETATYNVDEFYETLIPLVKAAYRVEKPSDSVEVVEEKIPIYSYASLASMVFNQSSLGFSKERGGVSF